MDTREKILTLCDEHPLASLADIGKMVGVSRARVHQVIKAAGVTRPDARLGFRRARKDRPRQAPQPAIVTGGVTVDISHVAAGTVGELLVAADLIARGWMVFWPVVRTPSCNLLALSSAGAVERIEVRTARRVAGQLRYTRPDTSKSDRRAIVVTGEPVQYSPPFVGDGILKRGSRRRPETQG